MSRSFGGRSVTTRSPIEISPVGDLLEAGDHAQQRGLAAAGRADEHHELAVADLERHLVDRDDVAAALKRFVTDSIVIPATPTPIRLPARE